MSFFIPVLEDAVIDALKILPFLFLTYLVMEYLEHKTQERTGLAIERAGRFGPLFGGVLGAVPQCGFSTAASNLYAGRVITLGTLMAVYLSTSDEMLPLLISNRTPLPEMARILLLKAAIGAFAGFFIDFAIRRFRRARRMSADSLRIEALCEKEHCHCGEEGSIFRSALVHTTHIILFVLLFSVVLNGLIAWIGEDRLSVLLEGAPVLSHLTAALIGLIPNCAASVLLTQLYLDRLISFGAAMSGLLVSAGVGLLVLYRVNPEKKENIQITVLLYLTGLTAGALLDLLHWR